ncbi:MAG: PIN domain-containing protein [Acidobacteriota bacterium]
MKPNEVLLDTSAFINYPQLAWRQPPDWFSMVVLQELLVGGSDKSSIAKYQALKIGYERRGRLLTPDADAWWQAGKILGHFLSDLSRGKVGRRRPQLDQGHKQSLIRDVLIAVTAKQHGLTVVSDNKDFPLLQGYYKFKWIAAREFFA